MINIVYKYICQQIVSQHYSTFLFQKSFYCFETGISLFFCLWIQIYRVFCTKLFENSALRIINFLSTASKTTYLCHEGTST